MNPPSTPPDAAKAENPAAAAEAAAALGSPGSVPLSWKQVLERMYWTALLLERFWTGGPGLGTAGWGRVLTASIRWDATFLVRHGYPLPALVAPANRIVEDVAKRERRSHDAN